MAFGKKAQSRTRSSSYRGNQRSSSGGNRRRAPAKSYGKSRRSYGRKSG